MDALRLPNRLASKLPGKLGERAERPVVSLVRLHGVIAAISGPLPRSVINAAAVEKTLERAFAPDGLAAVALLVNSPGGSPHAVRARRRPHPRARRRGRGAGAGVLRGRRGIRRLLARLCGRRDLRAPHLAGRVHRGDQPGLRARRPHRAVRRAAAAVHGGHVQVAPRPVPPGEGRGRPVAARAAGRAARDVPPMGDRPPGRQAQGRRRALHRRGVDRRAGTGVRPRSTASAPPAACSPSASRTPTWCPSRPANPCSPGSASARLPRPERILCWGWPRRPTSAPRGRGTVCSWA